jgi:hypothetical protein
VILIIKLIAPESSWNEPAIQIKEVPGIPTLSVMIVSMKERGWYKLHV